MAVCSEWNQFCTIRNGSCPLSASFLGLDVRRHLIQAVSAGDQLIVKLELENQQPTQDFVKVQDLLPFVLGQSVQAPIEIIPPHQSYQWIYYYSTSGCLPLADGTAKNSNSTRIVLVPPSL